MRYLHSVYTLSDDDQNFQFLDMGVTDEIGFAFFVVGSPIFGYTYYKLVTYRSRWIKTQDFKNLKKETDVELYVCTILQLIDRRGNMTLENFNDAKL